MFCEWLVKFLNLILEPAAIIFSAGITAGIISKSVSKLVKKSIDSYDSTRKNDLHYIMRRAEKEIIIVTACGDKFLTKYKKFLEEYMKKGVTIKVLIQDFKHYKVTYRYTHGDDFSCFNNYKKSIRLLYDLKSRYKNQIIVKEFHSVLTESYIGVDLILDVFKKKWMKEAMIQCMPYRYLVDTKFSPFVYLTPTGTNKKETEYFERMVDVINKMWDDGK